jgi:hypothetical protein
MAVATVQLGDQIRQIATSALHMDHKGHLKTLAGCIIDQDLKSSHTGADHPMASVLGTLLDPVATPAHRAKQMVYIPSVHNQRDKRSWFCCWPYMTDCIPASFITAATAVMTLHLVARGP